jgi:hypothetical protein
LQLILSLSSLARDIPEDTQCPLEALVILFDATRRARGAIGAGPQRTATILHIRKWMKRLVDRSLVLGSVDRPSLHDIVLDFCQSQFNPEQLRAAHINVVETFRDKRPPSRTGALDWNRNAGDLILAKYICQEVDHHIQQAVSNDAGHIDVGEWLSDPVTSAWLRDIPQDAITVAAGNVIGVVTLEGLAQTAQDSQLWWDAALRWGLTGKITVAAAGRPEANKKWRIAVDCLEKAQPPAAAPGPTGRNRRGTGSGSTSRVNMDQAEFKEKKDSLELDLVKSICSSYELPDIEKYRERLAYVSKLPEAMADPHTVFALQMALTFVPTWVKNDDFSFREVGKEALNLGMAMKQGSQASPNERELYMVFQTIAATFGAHLLMAGVETGEEWEELYGEGGCELLEISRTHVDRVYEQLHIEITESAGWDPVCHGGLGWTMAVRWGNLTAADELWNNNAEMYRRTEQHPDRGTQAYTMFCSFPSVPLQMALIGRGAQAAKWLVEFGWSWEGSYQSLADSKKMCEPLAFLEPKAEEEKGDPFHSTVAMLWYYKCVHALCDDDLELTAADKASIPDPDELHRQIDATMPEETWDHSLAFCSVYACLAMALEKWGETDRALAYCELAIVDVPKISDESRVLGNCCKGRILVGLHRLSEATACFETAASAAQHVGARYARLSHGNSPRQLPPPALLSTNASCHF